MLLKGTNNQHGRLY